MAKKNIIKRKHLEAVGKERTAQGGSRRRTQRTRILKSRVLERTWAIGSGEAGFKKKSSNPKERDRRHKQVNPRGGNVTSQQTKDSMFDLTRNHRTAKLNKRGATLSHLLEYRRMKSANSETRASLHRQAGNRERRRKLETHVWALAAALVGITKCGG